MTAASSKLEAARAACVRACLAFDNAKRALKAASTITDKQPFPQWDRMQRAIDAACRCAEAYRKADGSKRKQ